MIKLKEWQIFQLIQKLHILSWRISASLYLSPGIIMVGVIIGCKRMGLNPDNVATPIAASFGDLITLALLVCFSQWFYSFMGERTMDIMILLVTLHRINQDTEESFFINIKISATHHSFWYSPRNKCKYNLLDFFVVDRALPLRAVPGWSFLFMFDTRLDDHLFQTPSQSHSALHRLGTNHCSNDHQQVLKNTFQVEFIMMACTDCVFVHSQFSKSFSARS